MKRCPACKRAYTDDTLRFCLEDGTPLEPDRADAATLVMPSAPATAPYGAQTRPANATPQAAWTPTALPPRRRMWPWVLGAFILLCILGIGCVVLIIGIAALNSNSSTTTTTSNSSNSSNSANTSTNSANTENTNDNSNSGANANSNRPRITDVEIVKLYMAKDNGSGAAGDETDTFTPTEHTVHLMVELNKPAEGTEVRFDWIAVDAGSVKDFSMKKLDYTTKTNENKVHAQLTWPKDWPEGDYKVDVYINDQLARSLAYKIAAEP
jgi:hypothetical protein